MPPKRSTKKNRGGLAPRPAPAARTAPTQPEQPLPPAARAPSFIDRPFRDPYPISYMRQGPYFRTPQWNPDPTPDPQLFRPVYQAREPSAAAEKTAADLKTSRPSATSPFKMTKKQATDHAQPSILRQGNNTDDANLAPAARKKAPLKSKSSRGKGKGDNEVDDKGPTSAAIEAFAARQAGTESGLVGSSLSNAASSSASTLLAAPSKKMARLPAEKRKLTPSDNHAALPAPKQRAIRKPTSSKRVAIPTTTTQLPNTFRDKTSSAPITGANGFQLLHPQPVFKRGEDGSSKLTLRYIDNTKSTPQTAKYAPRGAFSTRPIDFNSDADISRVNNWVCQFLRRRGVSRLRGDMTERVWSAEEVEWLRREVGVLRAERHWKTKRALVVELTKSFNKEWEGKGVEVVKGGETVEVARGARSEQAVQTRAEKEGLIDGVGRKKNKVEEAVGKAMEEEGEEDDEGEGAEEAADSDEEL